ncbi:hypothetical protein AS156_27795 [Bradyrhizobium macuxiense]|uniref:Uncharacterized protein n=1 Tax=Bradyrhizobium macuxiense TaxID=1755647 RepID=A0A109K5K6_9BRAD|nr:hypothetical protein [Bradyrhizobium macuxiense]KWV60839.1 hypothetical protein AS156_27795 [Bradyrhizobium macuxiense]
MLSERQFLFLREAALQLQYALDAFEEFARLKQSSARPDTLFKALDDFLDHAARVEAVFWPTKKYFARGQELRELLSVKDDNYLHNHELRNRLQHFDEYLDDWIDKPQTEAHIGDLLVDSVVKVNGKRIYGLREFDSATTTYIFNGKEFLIGRMAEAARSLMNDLQKLPPHPLGTVLPHRERPLLADGHGAGSIDI